MLVEKIHKVLHLCERWDVASQTNVILFVGEHPIRVTDSASGQVVFESLKFIQLHSCLLDKKRSITFVRAMGCSLSHKCNAFRQRSSDEFVGLICRSSSV